MKIALVTDAIGPFHQGGKEVRYHEISQRLSRGHSVVVYTMNWWGGERTWRNGDVMFRAISPCLSLYHGPRRSIRQAVVFALACLRLLGEDFDVIEADHMPYMPLFTLKLVSILRGRRLVATWHECWGREYWESYLGTAGRIGWWFEKLAMRLPDTIIAASPETQARLLADLPSSVTVILAPNGVDLELIRAIPAPPDASEIITVSRLLPHKRVDLLLDALAMLAGRGQRLTVTIVGSGPLLPSLQLKARQLGLEGLVRWRQDVATSGELYGLLKGAQVAIFPSEREGFGMAVLESLACGTPVITTSAPDNLARHLVEAAGGGTVCAPDAAELADAIAATLAEGGAPGGTADPRWLAQYDWNTISDTVAGVLR